LVYEDDVNYSGDCVNTIKENTESITEASRDLCLEINAEKTNYMIISRHPKIANESFEKVAKLK
jgi:hypothetical protein